MNFEKIPFYFFVLFFLLTGKSAGLSSAKEMTGEAERLYRDYQQAVYQIQVIDLATGKKSAVGSGFQFSAEGHLATNYHVVSMAVHSPGRFRVEYVAHDGTIGTLRLLDIDPVHDLAVVQRPVSVGEEGEDVGGTESCFTLGKSDLAKGTRIFSMGNPYDLGMSIIEGTYNGLMENSLHRKILFSGSLNPGMSGGPALNRGGEVLGINVATAGNDVSFLVPVDFLKELSERVRSEDFQPVEDWKERIKGQLIKNQDHYVETLLSSEWPELPIGEALVPGEILNVFKCWGESKDEEEKLFNYAYVQCSSEDQIFISQTLSTGQIWYKYSWMTSKGLNSIRFYNLYQSSFARAETYANAAEEEEAGNFQCTADFVDLDHKPAKVSYCARPYKKFSGLFDINLSVAQVSEMEKGLLMEVIALGVSRANADALVKKFLEAVRWKK